MTRRVRTSMLVAAVIASLAIGEVGQADPAAAAANDISTVAGTGVAGYSGDCPDATDVRINVVDLAVAPDGSVTISNSPSSQVQRLHPDGYIELLAGAGATVPLGDGGPARDAYLGFQNDVAHDAEGNLYIADTDNHRVRVVDAGTGIITTLAGTGSAGYSGDGGPATAAQLQWPTGLALDTDGNVYIADSGNDTVRAVDAGTGTITTIAGTGSAGYSGDGGPATAAQLRWPTGLALDTDGNVYIADTNNHRVRHVDADTGTITTLAGTGSTGYSGDGGPATAATIGFPEDVELAPDGDILIADVNNGRLRRIDDGTGIISTIAGASSPAPPWSECSAATSGQLNAPQDVAHDDQDNVYVTESNNHAVRKVDAENGLLITIAGTGGAGFSGDGGPASDAQLAGPRGVELDSDGNLYIADRGNNRIRRVDAGTGIITTVAGKAGCCFSGDGGPATNAHLDAPEDIAFDPDGNLYISDNDNDRIRRVDADTGIITTFAGTGTTGYSGDGGPATAAQLNSPRGLAYDGYGHLVFGDGGNRVVRRINLSSGVITTVAGTGVSGYSGDGGPATNAQLKAASDVTADAHGNLYIADTTNFRVRRVDALSGTITTVAGNGTQGSTGDGGPATQAQLANPSGVSIDDRGDLLIADTLGHDVRRVEDAAGPGTGQLRVTTSPALPAEIRVDGIARDSWGLTWVPFAEGLHEVCFGPMPGFTTPPCQEVTVLDGQITNVVGAYQARGYLRVLTSPALPSTITVDGVPRNDWGVWTEVDPGTYEVCFGNVSDWAVPDCEDATVTAGATTTITGEFVSSPGAPSHGGAYGFLRATTDPAVASRISVDGEWRDSWGLTWLKVPTGAHEVCFDAVLYADSPTCQNIVVGLGATATVAGPFAPHGFLRVLTDPAVGATVFVDGDAANAWGVWTSKPPGTYEVCYGPAPGLITPPCEDAVVSAGDTTTVTGTFIVP